MLSVRRYEPGDRQAVWDLHNLALHDAQVHGGNSPTPTFTPAKSLVE